MTRLPGFYWVRFYGEGTGPEVAKWYAPLLEGDAAHTGFWLRMGSPNGYDHASAEVLSGMLNSGDPMLINWNDKAGEVRTIALPDGFTVRQWGGSYGSCWRVKFIDVANGVLALEKVVPRELMPPVAKAEPKAAKRRSPGRKSPQPPQSPPAKPARTRPSPARATTPPNPPAPRASSRGGTRRSAARKP